VQSTAQTNAFAERWAQTLQHEALDHFIVVGERHLQVIISDFLDYYHQERPHQSLGNKPLVGSNPDPPTVGKIVCKERLGGLLKHYYRKAS
jgi:putative transposase